MKNFYQTFKSKMSVAKLNLVMLIILIAFTAYTLLAPIVPAVYGKPTIQDSAAVYAGHTMTYTIHSCRRVGDGVVTTITRQLVPVSDKKLLPINLSTDIVTNTARCQTNSKTLLIPYSTPDGQYKLVIKGVYAVIPLRQPITVVAESDTFTIHGTTITQEIQDLIDANTALQAQLAAQVPKVNGSTTAVTQNSNGSSTTSTNTNKTTTSGATPAPVQNPTPAPTPKPTPAPQPGLIEAIIKALGIDGITPVL